MLMPHDDKNRPSDQRLLQIVDAALAKTARRSGSWLACRPGCTQCCEGTFAINQLDAQRLRLGLAALDIHDPPRAARVHARVADSAQRLRAEFPGNPETGLLDDTEEARRKFEEFGNDEICPLLDRDVGLCDLYSSRPMTCRIFGPPVRSAAAHSGEQEGLGVCELCYQGATPEEIAACEMTPDPDDMEARLLEELESATGSRGKTIVAFCFTTEARHGEPQQKPISRE